MKEIMLIVSLLLGAGAAGKAFNAVVMHTQADVNAVILGMGR